MEPVQKIEVSTMITQQLRDLHRPRTPMRSAARSLPLPAAKAEHIVLRRDGARPMQFQGQLLMRTRDEWRYGHSVFEHAMSLYLDNSQNVVAALSVSPEENAAMRPSHWAQAIPDLLSFERFLDHWCRDVLVAIIDDPPASLSGARAALHSMTAHTLRVATPHTERKDLCLQ